MRQHTHPVIGSWYQVHVSASYIIPYSSTVASRLETIFQVEWYIVPVGTPETIFGVIVIVSAGTVLADGDSVVGMLER